MLNYMEFNDIKKNEIIKNRIFVIYFHGINIFMPLMQN
jgi:hypothetical protein